MELLTQYCLVAVDVYINVDIPILVCKVNQKTIIRFVRLFNKSPIWLSTKWWLWMAYFVEVFYVFVNYFIKMKEVIISIKSNEFCRVIINLFIKKQKTNCFTPNQTFTFVQEIFAKCFYKHTFLYLKCNDITGSSGKAL